MESIGNFVIEQLAAWEVPGCAVTAVQHGKVVLQAGWGHRDLEAGLPVTPDTLFAIGSVTKAFTAATVGALVDDGLLEWDRPLRDYLPDFRLHDPFVTDHITVTDLLAHRSGLPRHDLVWLGHPDLSRAELVKRLRFLPLSYELSIAGSQQARSVRRVVPDAPLPRPLDAYAGQYRHPGYGTITITAEEGRLRPRFGTMELSLTHRHYETFDLEWHELGEQSHVFPLMFQSDPDGDITALTAGLEDSVGPLRFDRLPDDRASDPEVLRRLCGTYALGSVELIITQQSDRMLAVTVPGNPPIELRPGRGLRFGLRGQPGTIAEFDLDDAGAVTRLVLQPFGIFLPKP